jgi:nitroreductase
MELLEAIRRRRAVRDYLPDAIDEATLEGLIHAAVQAPSAVDSQPWRFVVVRQRAMLDRVAREAKAWRLRSESSAELRVHLENPGFQIFYNAPVLVLIAAEHESPWMVEDCALAAQNLMLAACDQGLGSCWIGLAQDYLRSPAGKELLGIPPAWAPVAPIIVGRPRGATPPHPRREPQVRWID